MTRSLILTTFAAAIAAFALIPAADSKGATANGYNTFTIPQKYDDAVGWYEAHRSGVLGASNCHIVKDLGNGEYQVQTNTPIGACHYVLKETREDRKNEEGQRVRIYCLTFVRNISGRLSYQRVTIQLTDADGKTMFQEWMTTSVAGRFVPVFAVSNVQQSSFSGCRQYVLSHADDRSGKAE